MGVGVRVEGTAGEGYRRRPVGVAAAARGKRRGRHRLGQHANLGGALGSRGARGVAGRLRARAGSQAQGGGGNGGWGSSVARGGEEEDA
jgi:hypothetical protein